MLKKKKDKEEALEKTKYEIVELIEKRLELRRTKQELAELVEGSSLFTRHLKFRKMEKLGKKIKELETELGMQKEEPLVSRNPIKQLEDKLKKEGKRLTPREGYNILKTGKRE